MREKNPRLHGRSWLVRKDATAEFPPFYGLSKWLTLFAIVGTIAAEEGFYRIDFFDILLLSMMAFEDLAHRERNALEQAVLCKSMS
jgi:hypothetical protein